MPVSSLIRFISDFVKLSDKDLELLTNLFKHTCYPKGAILEREGKVARRLYYIANGFVRICHLHESQEITTQIAGPDSIITSFDSFVSGVVSLESVMCITDCDLFYISRADYDILSEQSINWMTFCKKIYENTITFNQLRTTEFLTLSAEKRYLKLLSEKPDIIKNVPVQYIASYLGVKPESLSRIRKNILS